MAGGAAGHAPPVRPVRGTSQTVADLGTSEFRFRGHCDARFSSFGRGTGGWHGDSGGV
jgi:hypothetical protein